MQWSEHGWPTVSALPRADVPDVFTSLRDGSSFLHRTADKLPVLTGEQVCEIIEHCTAWLSQWGEGPTPASSDQLGAALFPRRDVVVTENDALIIQRQPATRAELLRVLADLAEYDQGNYDSWREVGQIIHHETGGSSEGLEIFIKYSRCLSGFYAGAEAGEDGCRRRWRSFGRSSARPVTFGTLIHRLTTLRASRGPQKGGDSKGQERNMPAQVRVTDYTSAPACAGIKAASDKIGQ